MDLKIHKTTVDNPFGRKRRAKAVKLEQELEQDRIAREHLAGVEYTPSNHDYVREPCDVCPRGFHLRDRKEGEEPEIRSLNPFNMGSPHSNIPSQTSAISTSHLVSTISQSRYDRIVGEELDMHGRIRSVHQDPYGNVYTSPWEVIRGVTGTAGVTGPAGVTGVASIEDKRGKTVESDGTSSRGPS
jgi:hypothetical protein